MHVLTRPAGAGVRRADWIRIWAAALAILGAMVSTAWAAPVKATDFRIAGDAVRTRIVIGFDAEPELRWLLLRGPHRLVVDLSEVRFAFQPGDARARGLVRGVVYGSAGAGRSRIILSTEGPFQIDRADVLANEDGHGSRLVLDISAASERAFEAALADQAATTASTAAPKAERVGPSVDRPPNRFTVVIDPGHGGIDGGANGITGTVEKDVTLAFARELRDRLKAGGSYDIHLTRDSDLFLRLDERVRIARQLGADLFISIHADTINVKGVRGATVYTVSDKASDAEAQALADRENLSDKLGGVEFADENQEVADILVDLIRRETHAFSIRFAKTLVGTLGNAVGLINNPHRYAGFKVLKAPDVPSVLVELGYLSNAKDEAQLRDPQWRSRAVKSIADAVAEFAASKAAGG
jgi:N-acetylmuramoyl-L-alanine amidase